MQSAAHELRDWHRSGEGAPVIATSKAPQSLDLSDIWPDAERLDEALSSPMPAPKAKGAISDAAVGLKLKRGTEIVDREQHWLVTDFLPDDSLILVAGQVGLGKTTACMDWAASITNGRVPIIGGKRETSNVLMLSNEDSEAQLRRIFTRLGGDLSRLFVEDENSDLPWGLSNIPALETHIFELRPALVIIDSLTTHKPSGTDLNSHGDVAPMLVALRKLAATYGCAIVVIHHTNKMQTGDPLAKISGSIGITATARHVILIAQHPEDENSRVAAIAKTNLVRPDAPGYRFCLNPFGWHGETDLRASDLLQVPFSPQLAAEKTTEAETFLRDALKDGHREDSVALARQALTGYGIKNRTLQRAARSLGIARDSVGFGKGRKVYWSLASTISDTISDTSNEVDGDGPSTMNSALLDAGLTIDDTRFRTGGDGGGDVSPMSGEPVFDVEL